MTDKYTLKLNIPADCADPELYVRNAIDAFISDTGATPESVNIELNYGDEPKWHSTTVDALKEAIRNNGAELDVKSHYPETYSLPNTTAERIVINVPADCANPEEAVSRAIDLFCEAHPTMAALPGVDKEQWIKRIMHGELFEQLNGDAGTIEYPVDALLAMDSVQPNPDTSMRGCTSCTQIYDDSPYLKTGDKEVADLNKAPKVDLKEAMTAPEIKCMPIADTDVVAVDMAAEYTPFIRKWAEDRNIIGGGSTTLDQFIKGLTEAGELWTHIGKGQRELMKDDVGDIYVCLVNAAGNFDIKLEEHIRPLAAYNVHSGRSSYRAKGLKRYSMQVLYSMAAVAQSIENVLDSDNERDVEFFKTDFCEACADVVYALETIALENDWTLSECVIAAYEDIKDRRGLMVSGTFVKERDITFDMAEAILADERTNDSTREYLSQWALSQIGETLVKIEDAVEAKTTERRKPFWRIWNEAQGNIDNLAPFTISGEVAHLLSQQEGDQIAVTLGVFGQPNYNNESFVLGDVDLKAALDAMIGKPVGEVENPQRAKDQSRSSWVERVDTIDTLNSAGTLLGYAINDLGMGPCGQIVEVVGLVEPSAITKDRVASGGNVYFGIRAIVTRDTVNTPHLNFMQKLVCFDLSIENPREPK